MLSGSPFPSPDGKVVVVGTPDLATQTTTYTVYGAEDGRQIYQANGPGDGSFWLSAVSPESSKAAIVRRKPRESGKADVSLIQVVDLKTGKTLNTFEASAGLASGSIIFPADGNHIAFPMTRSSKFPDADSDNTVYAVMDVRTGEHVNTYKFTKYDGLRLISDDGTTLLSFAGAVYDAKLGAIVSRLDWSKNYKPVGICIMPGGKRVRAIDHDYSVRTWDAKTGKLLSHTTAAAQGYRTGFPCQFNKEGDRVYINLVQKIVVLDAANAEPIGEWSHNIQWGNITSMSGPEGSLLITVNNPETLEIVTTKFPVNAEFKLGGPTTKRTPPAGRP